MSRGAIFPDFPRPSFADGRHNDCVGWANRSVPTRLQCANAWARSALPTLQTLAQSRVTVEPWPDAFHRGSERQHRGVGIAAADDLQADRQALGGEAGG